MKISGESQRWSDILYKVDFMKFFFPCRWRKRSYRRHGVGGLFFQVRNPSQKSDARDPMFDDVIDAFGATRSGSMRETGNKSDTNRKSSEHQTSFRLRNLEAAIVPSTDSRKLPNLPYDPNYTEVYFAGSSDQDAVSLSSHSDSGSSFGQCHQSIKNNSRIANKVSFQNNAVIIFP